jgi:hypothetical protein
MGQVCETCGLTRWEGRQVEGWIDQLRAENVRLRDECDRAVEARENANASSVRAEVENHRLTASLELARQDRDELLVILRSLAQCGHDSPARFAQAAVDAMDRAPARDYRAARTVFRELMAVRMADGDIDHHLRRLEKALGLGQQEGA